MCFPSGYHLLQHDRQKFRQQQWDMKTLSQPLHLNSSIKKIILCSSNRIPLHSLCRREYYTFHGHSSSIQWCVSSLFISVPSSVHRSLQDHDKTHHVTKDIISAIKTEPFLGLNKATAQDPKVNLLHQLKQLLHPLKICQTI